jgi:hypothetical protein
MWQKNTNASTSAYQDIIKEKRMEAADPNYSPNESILQNPPECIGMTHDSQEESPVI